MLRFGTYKRHTQAWLSVLCVLFVLCTPPHAQAEESGAEPAEQQHQHIGHRIAESLRTLGWPDCLVVVAISTEKT